MSGPNLKLKLNTSQAAATPQPSANPTPTPTTLKLNLSRRQSEVTAGSPPAPQSAVGTPKGSKKNTGASATSTSASKKRKQTKEDDAESNKKPKIGPIRLGSQSNLQKPLMRKGSIVKLGKNVNAQASPTTPGGGQIRALRVKHKGKLPPRPLGVGYDSEAEEAEEDPAIEENIILRMLPGPDCDYVRNAIEEKKFGVPLSQGGADVMLRFFSKDARRAALRVRDKIYAAVLVDLPCIVESMKSWDKKGWWKSADVCQMLLVIGRVDNEDAARNEPLPRDVDPKTWQWPHGLTPPMHNVRKRRFRKRVSHKTIEQAELEVERLLEADEHAKAHGGSTNYQVLSLEQLRRQEEGEDVDDEEQDAEGDMDMMDGGYANSQAIDDDDDADWQAQFEAQLGADDDDEDGVEPDTSAATPAPATAEPASDSAAPTPAAAPAETEDSQAPTPTAEGDTPSADAQGSLPEDETRPDTPAEPQQSSDDEDEDDDEEEDDEDDDEGEEVEVDEETRERQLYVSQQREEIGHLERQIAEKRGLLANQSNPLLRAKLQSTIKRFEEEREVKRRGLGDGDEDD